MADTKINRDIKYINRDFDSLRNALIQYSKTYFPTTYNDFSPNSPGSLFMEMAAYVGDVLSFYLDNQVQETFLQYARQEPNLYELAYMMGYVPKATGVAIVDIDFYQQIPAKLEGGVYVPDYNYALLIAENTVVNSTLGNSTQFLVQDSLDFSFSSSLDPTEVSVYSTSGGDAQYFLLKKTRKAISATIKTTTFTDTISYITITVSDLILGQQATINTAFQNETRVVYTMSDILTGDDYNNWGSDDEYIINWVCQKYNLTLI
jgi:hypothetical protein